MGELKLHFVLLLGCLVLMASQSLGEKRAHKSKTDSTRSSDTLKGVSSSQKEIHDEQGHPGKDSKEAVENKGFARGRVFEYSYSTSHKDPEILVASTSQAGQNKRDSGNGSNNFHDHELARQTLPRFFSYPNNQQAGQENQSGPGISINQFQEAFKEPKIAIPNNFQPQLGEIAQASYFNYAPPSPPAMPPFMRIGFGETELDDDDSDGDLDFNSSSPAKHERVQSSPQQEDPKVKMVQVLMGRKNEKGKPWGTKTTLVYQDPKEPTNFMKVTEVKMNLNSKKDGSNDGSNEMSKVRSQRSFRGSSYDDQPSFSSGIDDFEQNEPYEPIF